MCFLEGGGAWWRGRNEGDFLRHRNIVWECPFGKVILACGTVCSLLKCKEQKPGLTYSVFHSYPAHAYWDTDVAWSRKASLACICLTGTRAFRQDSPSTPDWEGPPGVHLRGPSGPGANLFSQGQLSAQRPLPEGLARSSHGLHLPSCFQNVTH